jgi:hypothetical protein
MERVEKINKLKKLLEEEQNKEAPNKKVIKRLYLQIANLGIGLDLNILTQKPFTHV